MIESILVKLLKRKKLTLAAAESCSAGYFSYLLTKTPGASSVFKGGIIVYSLSAKNKFFKLSPSLLKKTEGVSCEIAQKLAKDVRKLFKADIGASIVGFAGPRAKKGIKTGTVFIAIADEQLCEVKRIMIKGGRDAVRKKSSRALIDLILKKLK